MKTNIIDTKIIQMVESDINHIQESNEFDLDFDDCELKKISPKSQKDLVNEFISQKDYE